MNATKRSILLDLREIKMTVAATVAINAWAFSALVFFLIGGGV